MENMTEMLEKPNPIYMQLVEWKQNPYPLDARNTLLQKHRGVGNGHIQREQT